MGAVNSFVSRVAEQALGRMIAQAPDKSRLDEIGFKVAEFAVACEEDQARFFLTLASDL